MDFLVGGGAALANGIAAALADVLAAALADGLGAAMVDAAVLEYVGGLKSSESFTGVVGSQLPVLLLFLLLLLLLMLLLLLLLRVCREFAVLTGVDTIIGLLIFSVCIITLDIGLVLL